MAVANFMLITVGAHNINIKTDTWKESLRKWQRQWEETTKGAINKEFFPSVERRLAVNLTLSPKVTTIMTGHGNIRSYLLTYLLLGAESSLRS
jgi:hypothetical protein